MHFFQYLVDFTPDIDHGGVRNALVRVHQNTLGRYVFDGTLLYCIARLPQPMELVSRRFSDSSDVRITFRLVGEIQKDDVTNTTVINVKCEAMLEDAESYGNPKEIY